MGERAFASRNKRLLAHGVAGCRDASDLDAGLVGCADWSADWDVFGRWGSSSKTHKGYENANVGQLHYVAWLEV